MIASLIDSPDGHGHTTGGSTFLISGSKFIFLFLIYSFSGKCDWKLFYVYVNVYAIWKFIGFCQVLVL